MSGPRPGRDAAGLVGDIFGEQAVMAKLQGYTAIGHNRYATTGGSSDRNIQPIFADFDFGGLALAHNGNIINAVPLRQELEEKGYHFATTTDSEVIAYLIVSSPGSSLEEKIGNAMKRLQGAYSLVLLTDKALLGVRDPMGVRPLCLGKMDNGWVLALILPALYEFDKSIIKYPSIRRFPGGASTDMRPNLQDPANPVPAMDPAKLPRIKGGGG